jgi:ubiquinone/menaquinone biosynthesis C-methylase UbiE
MLRPEKGSVEHDEYALMDAVEDRMWWYRSLHGHAVAALDALPEEAAVLDAGCGTGGFLTRLRAARPRARLYGLDYAPIAARRAADKAQAAVTAGTINALPFPEARFDAVVSLDVLCHMAVEEPAALAELHRVLKPGGLLVLNLPAHEWLRSAHDLRVHTARRYERREIAGKLAQVGFEATRPRHWNSLLLPLMVLQRKILKRDEGAKSDVQPFPPWLDASLFAVCQAESALMRVGLSFPLGGSVLATARRAGTTP